MGVIDSLNETNKKTAEIGEKFLAKSFDYYKLKIFQQITISVSMLFKVLAIGSVVMIGLVFLSLALAFKISDLLQSYAVGFALMGSIYLIMSIIIYLLRKQINNVIVKSLSKPFFNKDENV
jgi:hypothetical protein